MKREMKRKGFTLVELLIVIVVIGILSAMMMMSSNEAVTSAKASSITSNMRNLQTAALALWSDNLGRFNKTTNPDTPTFDEVLAYLKEDEKNELSKDKSAVAAGYDIQADANGWYIKYSFSLADDTRLRTKIASRASSLGILSSATDNATVYKATDVSSKNDIFLRVR